MEAIQRFLLLISPNVKGKTILAKDSMNSLKIENMGNKYNYENVLGEIACYIAKECNLTPSEAIGVVMNDECTDAVIEEIQKSDRIDIEALASRYLTEELC